MNRKVDTLYNLIIQDNRLFDAITDELYEQDDINEISKMLKNEIIRFTDSGHRNAIDKFVSACINSYISSVTDDEWMKLAEKVVKYFSE